MQLRISNANPQYHHSPFNTRLQQTLKHTKNQPVFTYINKEMPKNIYADNNPYLLYLSPPPPKVNPLISTRHTNYTREMSQNSSQRSLKVVRANGLRLAQKPKIGRGSQTNSLHGKQINENSKRFNDFSTQLQVQNRRLREENKLLKQKLRNCQQSKRRQLLQVQQRIENLLRKTMQLQDKIKQNDEMWYQEKTKFKDSLR